MTQVQIDACGISLDSGLAVQTRSRQTALPEACLCPLVDDGTCEGWGGPTRAVQTSSQNETLGNGAQLGVGVLQLRMRIANAWSAVS